MSNVPTICDRCDAAIPSEIPAFLVDGAVLCRNCHDEVEPTCPNCGQIMRRKIPKSYGTCKECGERFYVARDQYLFDSSLLTWDQWEGTKRVRQAADALSKWNFTASIGDQMGLLARRELGRSAPEDAIQILHELFARVYLAKYPEILEAIGGIGVARSVGAHHNIYRVANKEFELIDLCLMCMELSERFGFVPNAGDIAWGQLVKWIGDLKTLDDLHIAYHVQALYLASEGRDAKHLLREMNRVQARMWKNNDVIKSIRVLAPPFLDGRPRCPAAERAAQRTYSFEEVIREPPVPCADCSWHPFGDDKPSWCACSFLAQLES